MRESPYKGKTMSLKYLGRMPTSENSKIENQINTVREKNVKKSGHKQTKEYKWK